MPHLGDDVAAFVDGQLSGPAMQDAAAHLAVCDDCEKAVRQQRLLKSRMSTVETPGPPAALLASLAELARTPPPRESRWSKAGRSLPLRLGAVLVGASFMVLAAAYAMGGAPQRVGDEVAPAYEGYVAEFAGLSVHQNGTTISAASMADLDRSGWPCHPILAGDLERVAGSYVDDGRAVALAYTDGTTRLTLVEQNGALDPGSLDGFTAQTMSGAPVWVREGSPRVITWDAQGTVYTVVTDASRERIELVVGQLPHGIGASGPIDRVGDGLDKMTSWMSAAA